MRTILLCLVVLVSSGGCTDHPVALPSWAREFDPLFTSVVWLRTGDSFNRETGNGVLVHSTREQGTYLLTTAETLLSGYAETAIYDYTHEKLEGSSMGMYRLEIIARDPKRDLLLARVSSRELFKTAFFHPEAIPAHFIERRVDIRMVSISPQGRPAVQNVDVSPDGKWHVDAPTGSRGSPVFCEGLLAGIVSERRAERIVRTREILEFLQDYGYGFIISVD